MNDRIVFHDSEMRVRWLSRAGITYYYLPVEKIIGRPCQAILNWSRDMDINSDLLLTMDGFKRFKNEQKHLKNKRGRHDHYHRGNTR